MDVGLICMIIGMIAAFMAGLYFERCKARYFIHKANFGILSQESLSKEDKAHFICSTGIILSNYYNDNKIHDLIMK